MSSNSLPLVDPQNPLYCPSIPATVYLSQLRVSKSYTRTQDFPRKRSRVQGHSRSSNTFIRMLSTLGKENEIEKEEKEENYCVDFGTPKKTAPAKRPRTRAQTKLQLQKSPKITKKIFPSLFPADNPNPLHMQTNVLKVSTPAIPLKTHTISLWDLSGSPDSFESDSDTSPVSILPPGLGIVRETRMVTPAQDKTKQDSKHSPAGLKSRKRKLESMFPDLFRNSSDPKKLKLTPSEPPIDEDSLSTTGWIRSLDLNTHRTPVPSVPVDVKEDRIKMLEDVLYGPPIGTDTPKGCCVLLDRLNEMLPGIRLRERLDEAKGHQGVVDFLGVQGLLNERVMEMFRTSEVKRLILGCSLKDEGGLNLGADGVFRVLGKPNSFLFVSELSFAGARIRDRDLMHIVMLPKLKKLCLDETGVGDEAIYHLTALSSLLTHLSLAHNPRISDESMPALILLAKLQLLSLVGTGIGMPGLRKLATAIDKEGRVVDVEIPGSCEAYVGDLENNARYLLYPQPPLITSPLLCARLSIGALKRNLEAHFSVATQQTQALAPYSLDQAKQPKQTAEVNEMLTKEEMRERLEGILRMREVDLLVWGMDTYRPNVIYRVVSLHVAFRVITSRQLEKKWVPGWTRSRDSCSREQFSNPLLEIQGYVARDDEKKEFVVAFRGRWDSVALEIYAILGACLRSHSTAEIEDSTVLTNSTKSDYSGYKIVTTGHSLGGALSTLCAMALQQQHKEAGVRNYTYGSPRVGNKLWAEFVSSVLSERAFRVVNAHDG
ncbi:hypothetical protein VNI00_008034 [Paramarasmius palmivorus]|uniref:Fungal lipase-type domain-containing protein n=1 Tax=Paramarasmius palmivorus TaxID=297713 RepID=A0AAW0CY54_9AGAR